MASWPEIGAAYDFRFDKIWLGRASRLVLSPLPSHYPGPSRGESKFDKVLLEVFEGVMRLRFLSLEAKFSV